MMRVVKDTAWNAYDTIPEGNAGRQAKRLGHYGERNVLNKIFIQWLRFK